MGLGSFQESYRHSTIQSYISLFKEHPTFSAGEGFGHPVGFPDGKGYYNAQPFKKNYHLGDDLNGVGGGDTDYGDDIHSIGNGYTLFASDLGRWSGWGKVIAIIHETNIKERPFIISLYAHCSEMHIRKHDWVKRGQIIGKIGNADGLYKSHLHFEVRDDIFMGIGSGYKMDTTGYINPSDFVEQHLFINGESPNR